LEFNKKVDLKNFRKLTTPR